MLPLFLAAVSGIINSCVCPVLTEHMAKQRFLRKRNGGREAGMDGKTGQTNAETRRVQKSQLMLFCSDFQEADYNRFHLNPALV